MPDVSSVLSAVSADSSLYEQIIKDNIDKRILVFNDEVNDCIIENYILYILKWNYEDMGLPVENRKPIKIYLNTPGGDTVSGFSLIDIIAESKTPVIGIVMGLCASMGFHILLACHERIAFKNSVLLKHDGEIGLQNSASKVKDTMKFFEEMEKRTKDFVIEHSSISEELYDSEFETEKWMYSIDAKNAGYIDKIIGIDDIDIDYII